MQAQKSSTAKTKGAEDFPNSRGVGDFSHMNKTSDAEYTRYGQMENRKAQGLNKDTGSPDTLVHSRGTYDKDAIRKASSPIPVNSRLAQGKFTKEDEETGKIFKRFDDSRRNLDVKVEKIRKGGGVNRYLANYHYDVGVDRNNAKLDRDLKGARGFGGKR